MDDIADIYFMGMDSSFIGRHHVQKTFHHRHIEDQLASIAAGRPCWITAPGASMALADAPAGDAVVMVGPEGGFVPFELALACLHKARPAHLGQRILSVDTALTTALAQGAINLGCRSTPG